MDGAIDCLMSFSDFLYAFQLQLYYQGTIKTTVLYWLCIVCLLHLLLCVHQGCNSNDLSGKGSEGKGINILPHLKNGRGS